MTTPARLTPMERVLELRRVEAFRRVPMEHLASLGEVVREEWRPAGSYLFREGDPPGALYVLLAGRVALERDGARLAEAGPGEALGTWSLFDDRPRRADARVAEDCRLLTLGREDFEEELSEHVEIVRALVRDLVGRLVEAAGIDAAADPGACDRTGTGGAP